MNILKKFNLILNKYHPKEKGTRSFSLLILLTIIIFILALRYHNFLSSMGTLIFIIIFSILIMMIGSMAALAVTKSLFIIGASLSLMLFLAQSYCEIPVNSRVANGSLNNILSISFLYILFLFCRSLYKEVVGSKKIKGHLVILKEANDGKKSWLLLILYALFIALFLGELYQVMYPIINNLCIYQK